MDKVQDVKHEVLSSRTFRSPSYCLELVRELSFFSLSSNKSLNSLLGSQNVDPWWSKTMTWVVTF
jgi:hypothetical protein